MFCVYYYRVVLPELYELYEHGLLSGQEFQQWYAILCG